MKSGNMIYLQYLGNQYHMPRIDRTPKNKCKDGSAKVIHVSGWRWLSVQILRARLPFFVVALI